MKQALLLAEQSRYVDGFDALLAANQPPVRGVVPVVPWGRLTRWVIGMGLLLTAGVFGARVLHDILLDPARFPLTQVSIEGEFKHLTPSQVEALVASKLSRGFFGIEVSDLRKRLLQAPWIRDASIRRVWPDALIITVYEQRPVAAWGPGALLNGDGDVFRPEPSTLPVGLMRLHGPDGSGAMVLAHLRKLAAALAPLQRDIESLTLDERGAWRFRIRGGPLVIVGQEHFAQRVERFVSVAMGTLRGDIDRFDRIDLRYTNGFAARQRRTDEVMEQLLVQ